MAKRTDCDRRHSPTARPPATNDSDVSSLESESEVMEVELTSRYKIREIERETAAIRLAAAVRRVRHQQRPRPPNNEPPAATPGHRMLPLLPPAT